MTNSESELLDGMYKRLVKNFLDLIIMRKLEKRQPMGGYDIIAFLNREFGMLVSSGTVYANLYSMERNGLIKAKESENRRSYVLTDKGKQTIQSLKNAEKMFVDLVKKIFFGQHEAF